MHTVQVLDLMIAGYMCTCGVGEDRPQKRHYVRLGTITENCSFFNVFVNVTYLSGPQEANLKN